MHHCTDMEPHFSRDLVTVEPSRPPHTVQLHARRHSNVRDVSEGVRRARVIFSRMVRKRKELACKELAKSACVRTALHREKWHDGALLARTLRQRDCNHAPPHHLITKNTHSF
jgi:hypothetical protein